MTAISGTRRAMKEMADGTIRVMIDIDMSFKDRFLEVFKHIDMPVALAPLLADFEQPKERPKGGELAKLAGQLCGNPSFQQMIGVQNSEDAANEIRTACGIESRAELDHNQEAAAIFHAEFRIPFLEMEVR